MINWKIIIVGILGLLAGYLLNRYANRQSEKKIIEAIILEIKKLEEKQSTSRLTAEEQNKMIELRAALNLFTT